MTDVIYLYDYRPPFQEQCRFYPSCHARICPLDSGFKDVIPEQNETLCSWYELTGAYKGMDEIPEFLFRHLLDYVVHLLHIGVLTVGGLRIPR